jgi:tRNA threonylcarbamoyladenosine biosynthesis protein TsaE
MHHHDLRGNLGQRHRPIDRRIAAAGDDDAFAAKILAPAHQVENAAALERLDAGERRAIRPERTAAGGNHHRPRGDPHPAGGGQDKPARRLVEPGHWMTEMVGGGERGRLLDQPLDQHGGVDPRIARDVVDRFFRVKRGALPARRVERVEHMAAHLQHAAFEHREEADRPSADDRDIGVVRNGFHARSLSHFRACRRLAARDTRPQMTLVDLPDENATAAFAARVAAVARPGDVIALSGELGAGKTCFARAFIRARSGSGDAAEEVPSPTFTLVQTYDLPGGPVWHFDLYRLRNAEEAWELGIEDAFREGISLIEWPERLGSLLPAQRLGIAFEFGPTANARRAALSASAEWRARLASLAAEA